MNKTLTINISGIVFNIEEDAYEALKNYLGKIKRHFSAEEGCEEIVADIEARLAELLKAKINPGKQVLLMTDINEAIAVMGQPEDFSDGAASEERKEETHTSSQQHYGSKRRRVFRDPDSKILGGVCSGIGNYFDIDPLWIRLALVIMFFGFGSGFLLYIILWIIIPEAKTTAEKLEMRGEPIDVNTISKTIKDEAENLKGRARDFGTNVRDQFANRDNTGRFVDLLRQIFGTIFSVLGKIIGFFFALFGIIFFVGLLTLIFGFGKIDNMNSGEFVHSLAGPDFPLFWAKVGLILAIGIPVVMLIYKGMKMLMGIKYHNRWISIGAGIGWVIGLIMSLCFAGILANEFSEEAVLKQQSGARWPAGDTLYVKANYNYSEKEGDVDIEVDHGRWVVSKEKDGTIWWGRPKVRVISSENDTLGIFIVKSARGEEKTAAAKRAKNISYNLQQNDSLVQLDKYYSFLSNDVVRGQEAEVLIKMPRNKVIFFDNSLKNLLYDVDNVNEIYDEDMTGKYWKMTDNGLSCISCTDDELEKVKRIRITDKNKKEEVKIDEHGIEVNSKDAHVKISEDGIKVDSRKEEEGN
jgi:phage shock protein PspC (stress-responsive transcriptional regulator)